MPLFTGRGFSGAAQQGFQQGFAQIVQTLMQDRAAAIQKDLEAQRLDAQAKMQKQESADRMALADKQIQAEGAKTRYTEGMANNRLERELLFRENANSQASTDATANRLSDQLFQSGEAAKTRDANATTEQNRLQMERDAAARQERQFGEKMALDAKQFDVTTGLQKEQQSFARERATKEDTFRAADIIGKAFERKDANAQRLQEHAMTLYAGGQDSVMKAYAARATDPANPNSAADLAELKRLANASPAIIAEAAHKIAVDDAMSFIQSSDDPSIAILKDVAPDAVRSALDTHLKAATQRRESAKTDRPAPTPERTDLGPLPFEEPKKTLASIPTTAEEKSRITRGEKTIQVGNSQIAIEAPPEVKNSLDILDPTTYGKDTKNVWGEFTKPGIIDDYLLGAFDKFKSSPPPGLKHAGYDTIEKAMKFEPLKKKLIRDAFLQWQLDERTKSDNLSSNFFM